MSNVTSVINHFATVNEGFNESIASNVLSGATIIPLTNVTGLTDATIFVGIIEPGTSKEQTFTGTVDLTGSRITGVVFTRGTNVDHATGAQVVDYVTGTLFNMLVKGLLVVFDQDGTLKTGVALDAPVITGAINATLTTPKITTSINDSNGNELIKTPAQASAVNEFTVHNAATGTYPQLEATGGDTNIGINLKTKGSPSLGGMQYNGVGFRTSPHNWVRDLLAPTPTSTPVGVWTIGGGTGWTYPSYAPSFFGSDGTVDGEVRYKIYLDAGTYTFKNWYGTGTDKGIITWGFITEGGGTTTIGSGTDTYNAATAAISVTATGVSFTDGGYYTLFFKASTKNASSSSYKLWYFGTQITRTA